MIILTEKKKIEEIREMSSFPNGFVKGVVDLKNELIAIDADMYYELADYLRRQREPKEIDMWGFNLWLDNDTMEVICKWIQF